MTVPQILLSGSPELDVLYTVHSVVCEHTTAGSANVQKAIILASIKAGKPEETADFILLFVF
jgi:hypothetical protein